MGCYPSQRSNGEYRWELLKQIETLIAVLSFTNIALDDSSNTAKEALSCTIPKVDSILCVHGFMLGKGNLSKPLREEAA
ncbi:uncharacterized protein N7479_004793 [Penicillium vulpinum]|uniref:uncharacterized protein n=1 Tax=Penicillium vulpinum TaxID=29845 RepID=UPI0025497B7A|nr:uncharacterized protein N7479_004793 [Penicillium vulpinum]KAJ5964917.1 hypothetical protein N7479_004793 [Penicillium vulpinum]